MKLGSVDGFLFASIDGASECITVGISLETEFSISDGDLVASIDGTSACITVEASLGMELCSIDGVLECIAVGAFVGTLLGIVLNGCISVVGISLGTPLGSFAVSGKPECIMVGIVLGTILSSNEGIVGTSLGGDRVLIDGALLSTMLRSVDGVLECIPGSVNESATLGAVLPVKVGVPE